MQRKNAIKCNNTREINSWKVFDRLKSKSSSENEINLSPKNICAESFAQTFLVIDLFDVMNIARF